MKSLPEYGERNLKWLVGSLCCLTAAERSAGEPFNIEAKAKEPGVMRTRPQTVLAEVGLKITTAWQTQCYGNYARELKRPN